MCLVVYVTCACMHSRVSSCMYLITGERKNLAYRGKASQSSTSGKGYANLAIDGNTDGNYSHRSCTETKLELNPWWMVTFDKELVEVEEVAITNRDLCCGKFFKRYLSQYCFENSVTNHGRGLQQCVVFVM